MPWHQRPAGLILAGLNAIATLDWAMSLWRDPIWTARLDAGQLAALYALPRWASLAWGTAVLAGLAGALLLLLGPRAAARPAQWAFALSLAGLALALLWQALLAPAALHPQALWALPLVVAELFYARGLRPRPG